MTRPRGFSMGLALGLTLLLSRPGPASAEGSLSGELDVSQALRGDTDLHVDILDSDETFVWTGKGGVEVSHPDGTVLGTFASGAVITPTMLGAYKLDLQEDQYDSDVDGNVIRSTITAWDVTVSDGSGTAIPGRLFSYEYRFNTGSFARSAGTNASFFARVPGGDAESNAVMDLRLVGLAGFIFEVHGNRTGVRGPNAGRSVPEMGNSTRNEYRMYLNPPENASYTHLTPEAADFRFRSALEVPGSVGECDQFVPGTTMGEFRFNSNVDGTFHIVCDLNKDDLFDIVDDGDFLILGEASMGENRVAFDGIDNNGSPFAPGEHQCRLRITVGEFHYVGRDIETSFEGLRMFQVSPSGTRSPLRMFWNDALVQSNAVTMPAPYAYLSAGTSGPTGIDSGDPADPPVPVGAGAAFDPSQNSRAWGDFVSFGSMGNGKGNEAYLDTYTWLSESVAGPITIRSVDGSVDTDGEGLSDYTEICVTGTEFDNPDTDGDTVNDFVETQGGLPTIDTDRDGSVDARDTDDDADCILTADEDLDGDMDPTDEDTDDDGTPNYLDDDDDGDRIPTCEEDTDGDGDPRNDNSDTDADPDYLDTDSDDDTFSDTVDECRVEPENFNGFDDEDGCPEADLDGDCIPDRIDNCAPPEGTPPPDPPVVCTPGVLPEPTGDEPSTFNPGQDDLDMDGQGDACDDDIDGDGLVNERESPVDMCPRVEDDCTGSDPYDWDTDDGGVSDGEEVANGTDVLDPIDDPGPREVTGGGLFQCRATAPARGGAGGALPLAWLALLGLLWSRQRRRGGR